jgi:uncharacterized protein YhdP
MQEGGWMLDVERYQVEPRDGDITEPARFSLMKFVDRGVEEPSWYGRFGMLRLQDANRLLQSLLPLDQQTLFALTTLQPQGELRDARFRYRGEEWRPDRLQLRATAKQLRISNWDNIPSVMGLDAEIEVNGREGHAQLASHQGMELGFNGLFIEPLKLAHVQARVDWQLTDQGWRFFADDIHAANADLTTRSRIEMYYSQDMRKPFLDMQVVFGDGDVANTYKYLPRGIMSANVVGWLEHALSAGRLGSGGMLFHGELGDFPFDKQQGLFEVRFNVEDTILSYQEGWPRAEELVADIVFSGRSMRADIVSARIFDLEVRPATAEIKNLTHNAMLELGVQAQGGLGE